MPRCSDRVPSLHILAALQAPRSVPLIMGLPAIVLWCGIFEGCDTRGACSWRIATVTTTKETQMAQTVANALVGVLERIGI